MINQQLEELSDLVRKGIPISFKEALAVIGYQENLQNKNVTRYSMLIKKIKLFFNKLKVR
jgi:hypothetical protein